MKKPQPKPILDVQRPAKRKSQPLTLRAAVKKSPVASSGRLRNHPFVVPVVTFLVLFFVSAIGFVVMNGQTIGASDSHIVQVSIDGDPDKVPTRARTVQDFLNRAKIDIHEGDVVEPSLDTPIDDDDFRVNVYRARPVTIIDGETRTQTLSAAKTPRSVAQQAGLKVYPEDGIDTIKPSQEILKDGVIGDKVVIDRATPAYLNLYGSQVNIRTRAKSVGEVLRDKNVKLGANDTVQPSADTKLTPNTQIFVTRQGTQIVSVEEEIAMPTETVEDDSISFGATAVRQQGSPGKKVVTYQIETQNGVEVGRKAIQEVVATEPVKQIVARGKAYSVPEDKSGLFIKGGNKKTLYREVEEKIMGGKRKKT